MTRHPAFQLTATVLDAPDTRQLAAFYSRLLGWPVGRDEPGWATVRPPNGGPGLSFQLEQAYVRPTWPAGPGDQQMQLHLDIEVDDLDAAGAHAVAAGRGPGRVPAPGGRPGLPRPGRPPVLPLGRLAPARGR
jgi:catechol 2,3-dioxygenase-like lactoylglutathione lyase family enzyme